jgi:sulfide:quinone oxidoreductase
VIVGGGFGGLAAAHELRTDHPELDVTLVARDDAFFMGFAKLWDLGRTRPLADGTRSLTALTGRGVRFVHDEVTSIDPVARTVTTAANGVLEADALLLAIGAAASPAHLALLEAPHAHDLYDARALPDIHADLEAMTGGRIVVSILGGPYKCPPAPYEAALTLHARLQDEGRADAFEILVTTPQPGTLPVAGPDASAYVARHLTDAGMAVRTEAAVIGVDADSQTISFGDGSTEPYDLWLGVPASAPPPIVDASGLAGESGWIEPDRLTLRTTFERVYAVGDCTHVPNAAGALPKAGVFAAAEARTAAAHIAADLGVGDERPSFDGHGLCFLELPGELVALVEGDFYAEPRPDVTLTDADHAQWERKVAFERDHLDLWLG